MDTAQIQGPRSRDRLRWCEWAIGVFAALGVVGSVVFMVLLTTPLAEPTSEWTKAPGFESSLVVIGSATVACFFGAVGAVLILVITVDKAPQQEANMSEPPVRQ